MRRKNKITWVYCPNCGEVADAALLCCEHCKGSLRDAVELDSGEAKRKKRRERSIKRDARRQAIKAKKKPFLKRLLF